jgi:hypothetical protein
VWSDRPFSALAEGVREEHARAVSTAPHRSPPPAAIADVARAAQSLVMPRASISDSQLAALPPMPAARLVVLTDNRLRELPEDWPPSVAGAERVELAGNRLLYLPHTISAWSASLVHLDVSRNHLVAVPLAVFSLTALAFLDLSFNQIRELADELGALRRLRILRLRGNLLETLPDQLGALARLVELDLRDNRLLALPSSVIGLVELRSLRLSGNPDLPIPLQRPPSMGAYLVQLAELSMMGGVVDREVLATAFCPDDSGTGDDQVPLPSPHVHWRRSVEYISETPNDPLLASESSSFSSADSDSRSVSDEDIEEASAPLMLNTFLGNSRVARQVRAHGRRDAV